MNRQRFIWLAFAAVFALSGALFLSTQRNLPADPHGLTFLPLLSKQLNTVSMLSIRKGSATAAVTLRKQAERWTVQERGDYPADFSKLRKLLLSLSDAKIVEEKTSNPANFAIIGVEDPAAPASAGAEINFVAQDGKHAVIVGKPVGEGNFARRGGENQSYAVEPGITFEAEPRSWIDAHLIDIAATRIQSVEVKPYGGSAYAIHRLKTGEGDFALDAVPSGRKAAEPAALAPSPSAFSGLTADDVSARTDIDFSKPSTVIVTLTDGDVIAFTGATSGDKRWIELKQNKDAALTAKCADRAFELSSYRYDAIFRPLEALLVPKPPPSAAAPKSSAPKKPLSTPK